MEKVVVITGASSGIGRVTARHLASKGMSVVLAARSLDDLEEVAEECRSFGIEVLVQAVDVSNAEGMQLLAEAAQTAFGHIDGWVNNAGVTEVGRFMEIDRDEFKRVVDTNLFGVVNGSRAALQAFLAQGRGTLMNVSSVLGVVPDPYESPYVASKFAVRGFTAALRQEMFADGHEHIHICTVIPSTVNTPIYHNAANKSGRMPASIPPVYPAQMVAEAIERLMYYPQNEVIVGGAGSLLVKLYKLMPTLVERLFAGFVHTFHFKGEKANNTKGNLFSSSPYTQESGGQVTLPKHTDKVVLGMVVLGMIVLLYKLTKVRSRHG